MTKPDYRAPVEAGPKVPLAVQAAQFAFWAPLVAILVNLLVGFALGGNNNSSGNYRQVVGWLVLTLNVAAFGAAIVALLGMRKHGKQGILVRSVIGMLMSGFILGSAVYVAYSLKPGDRVVQRLVGEWESVPRTVNGAKTKSHLSLLQDRTATVKISVGDQTLVMKGRWGIQMEVSKPTLLAIKWDAGGDPRMGEGVIWIIDSLNETQMGLQGTSGNPPVRETFQRQNK